MSDTTQRWSARAKNAWRFLLVFIGMLPVLGVLQDTSPLGIDGMALVPMWPVAIPLNVLWGIPFLTLVSSRLSRLGGWRFRLAAFALAMTYPALIIATASPKREAAIFSLLLAVPLGLWVKPERSAVDVHGADQTP